MFTVKYRESHYVTYWTCMKHIQTSTFHKTRILKSCLSLQKKKYSTSLNLPELQTTIEVTDFISFSLNQEIEAISKFTKNSSKQIMRNDVNIIL